MRRGLTPVCSLLIFASWVFTSAVAGQQLETAAKIRRGEPVRIVCFGDSVTGVYYHTGSRRAYTDMLGLALKQTHRRANITMVNAGISGHTTVNALARIDTDVLAHKPTLVTVMFGLNDMTRVSLETYQENLVRIIRKCRAVGAELVLCTPNNVIDTSSRPTEKLLEYCQVVRQVARDQDVALWDCYNVFEQLRMQDNFAWRMLMSDEIHPNMDGHKRIAEGIARRITGRAVSLADVPPPVDAAANTVVHVRQKQPIKVMAMSPLDRMIGPIMQRLAPESTLEIVPWPTEGKSLLELEEEARVQVRALKPDLVLLAIPRAAEAETLEAYVKSYAWVMNWSLHFSTNQWDCIVIHPSVLEPGQAADSFDQLVRQLVAAQDLSLVDRGRRDNRLAEKIIQDWLTGQGVGQ
jgi:lysophospholipase L1-like esterase